MRTRFSEGESSPVALWNVPRQPTNARSAPQTVRRDDQRRLSTRRGTRMEKYRKLQEENCAENIKLCTAYNVGYLHTTRAAHGRTPENQPQNQLFTTSSFARKAKIQSQQHVKHYTAPRESKPRWKALMASSRRSE